MSNAQSEIEKLRCTNTDLYKCDHCIYRNQCDRQEDLRIKKGVK